MSLVPVNGPLDVPELRTWMVTRFKPGGPLATLDGRFVHRSMLASQLWWVEEETCHLLADSAPTWPSDATLDITDMPTMAGFAVFAHDIMGVDSSPKNAGKEIRVSAICWGPVDLPPLQGRARMGIGIGMFTRLDLHKGLHPDDLMLGANMMGPLIMDFFQPGAVPGATSSYTTGREGTLFAYLGRTDWMPGDSVESVQPDNPHGVNETTQRSMAEDRRLLAALWAITRTPIVTTTEVRPRHHIARRSERKGLSAKVQVLRLGGARTQTAAGTGGLKRDWKHSWIVSPHFRWQPYGPREEGKRKLILISPYQKGDPALPLLGGERVWRVVPPVTGSSSGDDA